MEAGREEVGDVGEKTSQRQRKRQGKGARDKDAARGDKTIEKRARSFSNLLRETTSAELGETESSSSQTIEKHSNNKKTSETGGKRARGREIVSE